MFVEFIGIPGSGKTTLAEQLRGKLVAEGIYVHDPNEVLHSSDGRYGRVRRLIVGTAFCLRDPRRALTYLKAVSRSKQRSWRDAVSVITNLLCKTEVLARSSGRKGVHVSDEGIFHALWSACFRSQSMDPLLNVFDSDSTKVFPRHWTVFILDPSVDIAMARLVARLGYPNRLAQDIVVDPNDATARALCSLERTLEVVRNLAHQSNRKLAIYQIDTSQTDLKGSLTMVSSIVIGIVRSNKEIASTTVGMMS